LKKKEIRLTANEFVYDTIDVTYSAFLQRLEQCRLEYSEPGIHDLRVSARKMLSLVSLLSNFTDVPYLSELKKTLRKILRSLNPVRDLQVEVILLKQLIFKFPVLYTFYIHLSGREIFLSDKTGAILKAFNTDDSDGLIFFLRYYLKDRSSEIGFDVKKMIEVKERLFSDLIKIFGTARKNDMQSIHKVRLALKKYRYIEEALKPLTGLSKKRIKRMKNLQDHLGDIQDYSVIMERIHNFSLIQSVIPLKSYAEPLNYLAEQRAKAIDELFVLREGFGNYFSEETV